MDLKKYAVKQEKSGWIRKCPECDRTLDDVMTVDVRRKGGRLKPVRFCAPCFVRLYQEENQ